MDASKSVSVGLEPDPVGRRASVWRRVEAPRLFLVSAAGFVLLLVIWAALAEVHRVVRVEGRIIPAGRGQQIQHLEGGIVAAISPPRARR
jgi:adhesin transport system membrane fusion protein